MTRWFRSKTGRVTGSIFFAILLATLFSLRWYSSRISQQPLYPKPSHLEQQDDWQPFGGAWEMVDGAMRNNSDERGAEDHEWKHSPKTIWWRPTFNFWASMETQV